MLKFISGAFIVLHGLVHLLYFGQSSRLFELQPGMAWPDGSWAFSKLLGNEATRSLGSVVCVLAALVFVAGGAGIFAEQTWWRPVVVGAAIFSSVAYILLWNGKLQALDNQGWIGILINAAILVSVLVFKWPDFKF